VAILRIFNRPHLFINVELVLRALDDELLNRFVDDKAEDAHLLPLTQPVRAGRRKIGRAHQ